MCGSSPVKVRFPLMVARLIIQKAGGFAHLTRVVADVCSVGLHRRGCGRRRSLCIQAPTGAGSITPAAMTMQTAMAMNMPRHPKTFCSCSRIWGAKAPTMLASMPKTASALPRFSGEQETDHLGVSDRRGAANAKRCEAEIEGDQGGGGEGEVARSQTHAQGAEDCDPLGAEAVDQTPPDRRHHRAPGAAGS